MPNKKLSPGMFAVIALMLIAAFISVSHSQTPANDAYENQQRAIRVLEFDKDVATLPDPEIRALLRLSMLEFVYTKEVRSQYATAEPVLTAFFDDIKANEKNPVVKLDYLKHQMAMLLRKHYPEIAPRIEKTHAITVSDVEDHSDQVRRGADPREAVDKAVNTIRSTRMDGGALNLYETVRTRYPDLGTRLLSTVLEIAEKDPTPSNAAYLNRMMVDVLNPPASEISGEHMSRFHKVLVAAARTELNRAPPKDNYVSTDWPLRRAMSSIERSDKRLAAEAREIILNYRKFLSKERVAREEADDRIEAADDKLARAITEAEKALDPDLEDYLWMRAAQIALPRGKGSRKPSVDLIMKARPTLGTPDKLDSRDQWLRSIVRSAGIFQDLEGAKYAVDQIKDDKIRIFAMLNHVYELGRLQSDDRLKTAALADDVITQIEQQYPEPFTICEIGNLRYLMTSLTAFSNIRDYTARTVRIINKVKQDGAEAKPGSNERTQYFYLSRSLITCGAWTFRPLYDTAPAPPPELAAEIKVKEWRLAAQISAEKYRKYPILLPQ